MADILRETVPISSAAMVIERIGLTTDCCHCSDEEPWMVLNEEEWTSNAYDK
jgi:hypothetical protein